MVSKDDIIAELKQLVEKQAKQILALMAEVAQLKLQLAKATKNSSNSSKSPSRGIEEGNRGRRIEGTHHFCIFVTASRKQSSPQKRSRRRTSRVDTAREATLSVPAQ